jgi:hypothetical protein
VRDIEICRVDPHSAARDTVGTGCDSVVTFAPRVGHPPSRCRYYGSASFQIDVIDASRQETNHTDMRV